MKMAPYFRDLGREYLFPQITARKAAFLARSPNAQLVNLGIGDTTLPLPSETSERMAHFARLLATKEGYQGYGPEQGSRALREQIARAVYKDAIDPDEIFIGDGTKCDIARLQVLLGPDRIIGLQDPTYPAYRDSAILTGGGTLGDGSLRVRLLPCAQDNGYFPDLSAADPEIEVLFFCSPNNPTGFTASRQQLQTLIEWALAKRALIVFDAAYSWFIDDEAIPRSIYEIEGAKSCAVELNSFSKMAGFTGIRLSWSAVPKDLKTQDEESLHEGWLRIQTTLFNGASNIAQVGGLACLSDEGLRQVGDRISQYRANARKLRQVLRERGLDVTGGEHAPYLWAQFEGKSSWEIFDHLLEKFHLICTPGSGFGACGEGYIRLSALGSGEDVTLALSRLSQLSLPL